MTLSELPEPIRRFLDATRDRDAAALYAAFAEGAVLTDEGKARTGDEIRIWNETLYFGCNIKIHPLHVEVRDGQTVLSVAVDGDYEPYGVTEPFQLNWWFRLDGDRIAALRMVEEKLDLPPPVLAFVQAVNMFDGDALMKTFAPAALVNDQMCDHWGAAAIRRWADGQIIGDRVTLYVTGRRDHPGGVVVTAKVTGAYDKTGLPDPLDLSFYFTLTSDRIAQLIVVPTKSAT